MTELLKVILRYLPRYLGELGSVLARPKSFVGNKNLDAKNSVAESIVFLGLSCAVVVVMTAPLLPSHIGAVNYFASQATVLLISVVLVALCLRLTWRVVGGRASVSNFFSIYAYYAGATAVVFTVFVLIAEGLFKVAEPEFYSAFVKARAEGRELPELSNSDVFLVYVGVLTAGLIVTLLWSFVGWGAYRRLNGVSKVRSAIAFLLMVPLGGLVLAVGFLVASAMIR